MKFQLRLVCLLVATWLGLTLLVSASAEEVEITILSTTDLHGHILPVDYYTNKPSQDGIAKLATLIQRVRAEREHVLLLDSGDTIQGTPLAYYHNRINNAPPDPTILTMNALRFDAMAIGNHEFNFGLAVLNKARAEAKFPWLSANTVRAGGDEPVFGAYVVKEIAGVRVGILGLTTPSVPSWEKPENYAGLEFRDTVATAQRWVAVLREQERADLVVVPMHMGIERDLRTGEIWPGQLPGENAALAIAAQVTGVDVILMGHTHRDVPSRTENGVILTQARCWGDRLARVDVKLERDSDRERWRVVEKTATTSAVTAETEPDPAIVALAQPYHDETQAWLDREVGTCATSLSARDARLRDTAIMDLIQRVQLEAGDAEVSLAACFNLNARLPAGAVTVRDVVGLYVYDNTLVVVEITGADIKAALEHSAKYFRPFESGKTSQELIDDRVPGYNFDLAEGVEYVIDLRRPIGDRIVDLRFEGAPIDLTRKFRVAINNYRHTGGGGYSMYAGAPVLEKSSTEIRDLILAWVEKHRTISTEPTNNWRIVVAEE